VNNNSPGAVDPSGFAADQLPAGCGTAEKKNAVETVTVTNEGKSVGNTSEPLGLRVNDTDSTYGFNVIVTAANDNAIKTTKVTQDIFGLIAYRVENTALWFYDIINSQNKKLTRVLSPQIGADTQFQWLDGQVGASDYTVDTDGKFTTQGLTTDWVKDYPAAIIKSNVFTYSDYPGGHPMKGDTEVVGMFSFRVSAEFPDGKKVQDAQFSILLDTVLDNGKWIPRPENNQAAQAILKNMKAQFGILHFNQTWNIPKTWTAA
jgi:hypothetical protein